MFGHLNLLNEYDTQLAVLRVAPMPTKIRERWRNHLTMIASSEKAEKRWESVWQTILSIGAHGLA